MLTIPTQKAMGLLCARGDPRSSEASLTSYHSLLREQGCSCSKEA